MDDKENTTVVPEEAEVPEGDELPSESISSETGKETSEKTEQEIEESVNPETGKKKDEVETKIDAYDARVKSLAKSMADKSVATYQKKDQEWAIKYQESQSKLAEATAKLNEKTISKRFAHLIGEAEEEGDENKVAKLKGEEQEFKKLYLDYEKNSAYVEKTLSKLGGVDLDVFLKDVQTTSKLEQPLTLSEVHNRLWQEFKAQTARQEIWGLLFPEDTKKLLQVEKYMDKIMKAVDATQFEVYLEGITDSLKSNNKKFTPDSGRTTASAGKLTREKISKMSPEEQYKRSKEIKEFFDKE